MMPLVFQCFAQDPAAANSGMSGTVEDKRAAGAVVRRLGLQTDLRARALVLVAVDSPVGNGLRSLLQVWEDAPDLKDLVEEFLKREDTGKAMLCNLVKYSLQICCL